MRPVQHEHTVEVTIPPALIDQAEVVKQHIEEYKRSYLFGIGGVILGFGLARVFSRPEIHIDVNVAKD